MTPALKNAIADLLLVPHSSQIKALVAMLRALVLEYQDEMIDAKPERLTQLQAYCRQLRQIEKTIIHPDTHTPVA
jgi:hypothetical protein